MKLPEHCSQCDASCFLVNARRDVERDIVKTSRELITTRIQCIEDVAYDVRQYTLDRVGGGHLPDAEPGAHIDVHLSNGLVRQYSLVTPGTSPTSYKIGIKRDPYGRGGSKFAFDHLKTGDALQISVPRNNFALDETAPHTLLIAGGIGITPIWAMAQRLQEIGKPWKMHYACRSRRDAPFLSELASLPFVRLHFDDEDGGRFLDVEAIVTRVSRHTHLYCCGPRAMIDGFVASAAHIPPSQVHVEYFSADLAPDISGDFLVELRQSGREFLIPPGRTILSVLQEAGLDVPCSCEQGICGSCEMTVLSGTPDHRDSVLSDADRASNRKIMICCSGSKTDRLVLDF